MDNSVATSSGGRPAVLAPPRVRRLASARYVTCLMVLLAAIASMQLLASSMQAYFRKQELPLRKELYALDPVRLFPDYELFSLQPEPLTHDEVENLGTEIYLNWFLRDRKRDERDPASLARLFVTYYTGQPDMVPHNPRECMHAGGWTLVRETPHTLTLPLAGRPALEIPLAVLEFAQPTAGGLSEQRLVVLFFFYANGSFATTRNEVRWLTQNLFDRYAYYSKIELSFTDSSGKRWADRQQAVAAGEALLRRLMPILLNDHFQDWSEIRAGRPPL